MNKFSGLCLPKHNFVHTISTVMQHRVFVYGTLKRLQPNNFWLQDENNGKSKYVANGYTKTKYPLIIATKFNIPFLLFSPGKGEFVHGEIYEVDDKMLGKLDILEDHPKYYVREVDEILVRDPDTKKIVTMKCWVYFLKNFKPDLLKKPYMDSYDTRGPHGLPYMDRSKRDPLYNPNTEIKTDKES